VRFTFCLGLVTEQALYGFSRDAWDSRGSSVGDADYWKIMIAIPSHSIPNGWPKGCPRMNVLFVPVGDTLGLPIDQSAGPPLRQALCIAPRDLPATRLCSR